MIVHTGKNREKADLFADRLLMSAAESNSKPETLVRILSSELGNPKYFDRSFVVQLTQRLRDQDPEDN